ncbi:MAG: ADP-ribosylation factor-like protein [Candidatus Hodarchaeota archaeon]
MKIRVLLYGLEKSGKSTLINSFKEGHFTPGIPFTAQKTFEITINNPLAFTITEVGGRKEVRWFVSELLNYVDAIIFVIDGSDEGTFVDVKVEFDKIVNHPQSLGKPLAILFHKTDITQIHPSIIIEKLDILNRYDRSHRVFSSTAKKPEDFKQVLIWINNCLMEDRIPIQDQISRFFTIYILDLLESKKEGLPILSILGQLEIISRTGQVEYDRDKILSLLRRLRSEGDVEFNEFNQIWMITVQGREKLQSSELIKGSRYEKIGAMIDANQASPAKSDKIGLDKEEKDFIDDFDLDELADLYKKTIDHKRKK